VNVKQYDRLHIISLYFKAAGIKEEIIFRQSFMQ